MRVLDHEPHAWFLLGERGALFLDAHCQHGAFGYSVLIRLDAQETMDYCNGGRDYLGQLAKAIQDARTGQRGSDSPYNARDVAPLYSDKIATAVEAWQAEHPAPRDPKPPGRIG
jgi:hypothetical protein